jgi:hypothetical protein
MVKIYVNFQNHAKSPISMEFSKITFFLKIQLDFNLGTLRTLKKIHFKKYRQKVTIDAQVHFYKKWLKIKNFGVANYLPKIK